MQERISKYLDLIKERPDEFLPLGAYDIVTDVDLLEKFDRENGPIGVVYSNKWIMLVIDLINDSGNYHIYSRIIHANKGAGVVILPVLNGRIVFVRHIRHAIRYKDYMLELPRGFLDPDTGETEQAVRELEEEIGAGVIDVRVLGHTVADGGQCGGEVTIIKADISHIGKLQEKEGIIGYELLTFDEARDAVVSGMITDGYTQTALFLYESLLLKEEN